MVTINSTSFGEITIDGTTYYSDVVVWWDGTVEYRPKQHTFTVDDVMTLLKRQPEVAVIGRGQEGSVRVSRKAAELAEHYEIMLFIETSPRAAELFNAFAAAKKRVVAVIHTTT